MKIYKSIMNIVVKIENVVLAAAMLMVLALTFGNVIARKVFNHSWGFTEELVVAVFVLISLLAAGVAARDGGLVNLSLLPDHLSDKGKKVLHVISTICCVIYSLVLTVQGVDRMIADHTSSPILHIPKTIFWSFVVIGGVSLILHFIENCIDYCTGQANVPAAGEAGETDDSAAGEAGETDDSAAGEDSKGGEKA